MFPSLNLPMFTAEDGTAINNEDRILNKKKFTQLCNFYRALGKIGRNIAVQAFEAGKFWEF